MTSPNIDDNNNDNASFIKPLQRRPSCTRNLTMLEPRGVMSRNECRNTSNSHTNRNSIHPDCGRRHIISLRELWTLPWLQYRENNERYKRTDELWQTHKHIQDSKAISSVFGHSMISAYQLTRPQQVHLTHELLDWQLLGQRHWK